MSEFEPMTAADLDEVAALEQRIHAFPWTPGNFRDSLAAGHACWLRREAGAPAAYAVTMRVVDEEHLLDIGVAPQRQRQGLGAALLEFLCARARAAGVVRMLLEVRPSNAAAVAFYRHFDFAEIGRRRGYYPAHAGREDAIVMAKNL
ncbi:MAG: ribosomal protein S18-alanine N-acetyltransferase [Pseudomonadota bacterium]